MANKNYEVQFRLGAEMESSFARSFSSASDEFKNLQKQVTNLSKGKGVADTTKPVRDDLKQTQNEFRNTESAADRLGGMLKKAAVTIGGVFAARKIYSWGKDWVNAFGEFEQGLANVKAVSGATESELSQLGDVAKHYGATTAWTAAQVTDAQTLLAQAGYSVNETIAALPGLLNAASADQIELALATDIVAGTLKAFGLEANQSSRAADVLALAASATNSDIAGIGEAMKYVAPAANALSYDIEQTAAAIGLLSDANIKGSQAGTVLRAGLSRLAKPAKAAQKVMDRLGFSAFDAEGKMLPLDEAIGKLVDSTANLTEQQRIADITTIFGQEAMSGILALMEQGPNKLKKLTDELYNSSGAAQEMAETRLDSLPGSFIKMQSAIEAAKISLGEKLAPTIRRVVDTATDRLPLIVDAFENRYQEMVDSPIWRQGDWIERAKLAWSKIVAEPFGEWWNSEGREYVARIGSDLGNLLGKAVTETVKKAVSFDGKGSLFAAGALAIPAIKMGGGISTAVKTMTVLGKAGGTAAVGVGGATKAVGLFGPALSMLTNPLGIAIAGIGLLTAGVVAYRKRQDRMRQDLINVGDTLRKAGDEYQAVADKAKTTKELTDEYRELDDAIRNNVGTAEELAEAQQRKLDIARMLQDMFPNVISQYDIENDKIRERIGLLNEEAALDEELARLKYERTVVETNVFDLASEIKSLEAALEAQKARREEISNMSSEIRSFENELRKAQSVEGLAEGAAAVNDVLQRINERAGEMGLGQTFDHARDFIEFAQGMREEELTLMESFEKTRDELGKANASYAELYDAQIKLIELDLGGKIEEQAQKYDELTGKEKERFDQALSLVARLNSDMDLLTKDRTINVEVLYNDSRGYGGDVPEAIRNRYMQQNAVPSYSQYRQMQGFADGGFSDRPAIFGEAGLEAAIPIDNRPRSHALLEKVNQLMGHGSGGGGTVVYFNPTYNIDGDGNVKDQVVQASSLTLGQLEKMLNELNRNNRRVSFQR